MALQQIFGDLIAPFWVQTTTLDGTAYLLTFRFNFREQAYYLQIQSSDGTITYAQGIKLVPGILLLGAYATPPGELTVLPLSADDSPPRIGELVDGGRCGLVYIPAADLFTLGNTADLWRYKGGLPRLMAFPELLGV
jgi:hypothetical protein